MSRAIVTAAALVLTPIVVAVAVANSGALDWLSGDSASAALFADDVRLGPPSAGADPNEATEVELGVTGEPIDCPPAGAGAEDSEFLFQRQGANFWVTGTLSSFDGGAAVVAGPSGDVSATLAADFNLVGDLSAGTAVEMAGTAAEDGSMTARELRSVCAGAGVIDCATEEDPHFQLRIEGDTFEVTGRLDSLTSDKVSVQGPGLLVEISRDAGTQIEGGLEAGDPVRVEGTVLDAQQLRALAVALRCEGVLSATPAPGVQQVDTDENDGDDDEDGEDSDKCNPGEARGRGALRLKVHNGKAMIRRGALLSQDDGSLTVDTPSGPVSVLVDEDTDVQGDLGSALDVWITGEIQDDDSVLAEDIKVLCVGSENDDDEDEDERDGDDDDDGGEDDDEDEADEGKDD